jgi:hypothetical protein
MNHGVDIKASRHSPFVRMAIGGQPQITLRRHSPFLPYWHFGIPRSLSWDAQQAVQGTDEDDPDFNLSEGITPMLCSLLFRAPFS